jgi:hypothetical protein
MMSIASFALHCGVSRAAIYKAGHSGRIRFFPGPNGERQVNEKAQDSIDYRANVSSQRWTARQDKKIGTGIYARDGSGKSHRHTRAEALRRERLAHDPCRMIEQCWAAGGLPRGWAALCLADIRDPDNPKMVLPLYFYGPGGKDVYQSDSAPAYTVDLKSDPAVAIAADGTRHALTLRTFGRVSWVESASEKVSKQNKPRSPAKGRTA